MMKTIVSTAAFALAVSAVDLSAVTCNSNVSDGQQITGSNGKLWTVVCGTDYGGNDYKSMQTDTFGECIAACDADDTCQDASYVGNNCYMKNAINIQPSKNPDVWSVRLPIVDATANSLTCVDNRDNKKQYLGFTVYCATDFWGGDMANQYTQTFSQCIELCAKTQDCVDASYSGTTCYLKSTLTGAQSNTGVWSVKKTGLFLAGLDDVASSSVAPVVSSVAPVVSSAAPVVSSVAPVVSSVAPVVSSVAPVVSSVAPVVSTTTSKAPVTTTTTTPAASSTTTSKSSTTAPASSSTTTTSKVSTTTPASSSATSSTTKAPTTTPVTTTTSVTPTTLITRTSSAPSATATAKSIFNIISAFYDDSDVTTAFIKNFVTPSALNINMDLSNGIKAIGSSVSRKILTVLYTGPDGKQRVYSAQQGSGEAFNWASNPGDEVANPKAPAGAAIKIISAVWGGAQIPVDTKSPNWNRWNPVTIYDDLYQKMGSSNSITFNDSTFGCSKSTGSSGGLFGSIFGLVGDILGFVLPNLTGGSSNNAGVIYYTQNGVVKSIAGVQGETVRF